MDEKFQAFVAFIASFEMCALATLGKIGKFSGLRVGADDSWFDIVNFGLCLSATFPSVSCVSCSDCSSIASRTSAALKQSFS